MALLGFYLDIQRHILQIILIPKISFIIYIYGVAPHRYQTSEKNTSKAVKLIFLDKKCTKILLGGVINFLS